MSDKTDRYDKFEENYGKTGGRPQYKYWKIPQQPTPFRIMSTTMPSGKYNHSDRLPEDILLIRKSTIVNDSGKLTTIIWDNNPSWLFSRLYWTIGNYNGFKDDKKTVRKYIYAEKFPELVKRVTLNGRDNPSPYESGWKHRQWACMQGIPKDEESLKWVIENNQKMLLTGKIKNDFADPGLPLSLFNKEIQFNIINKNFDQKKPFNINTFDILMDKYTGEDPTNPKKIVTQYSFTASEDVVPLTDEEKALNSYNLDEVFAPASYLKLYLNISEFVKEVDSKMEGVYFDRNKTLVGGQLFNHLVDKMRIEKALWDEKYPDSSQYDKLNIFEEDGQTLNPDYVKV